jgi:hypothetical protein
VDTRSTYSYITPAIAVEPYLPLTNFDQRVALGKKGPIGKTLGIAQETIIRCGDMTFNYAFKVFDLSEGNSLIGFALMLKLGINLSGIPAQFPSTKSKHTPIDAEADAQPYQLPLRFENYAKDASFSLDDMDPMHQDYHIYGSQLKDHLSKLTTENGTISEFCAIPETVIYLETGNFPPAHRRQYPIAHALKPVVSANVDKWVLKGVVKETHELTA